MASPFDINPLASTVVLDDRGAGETTFTVKNVTAENIWGRATVVPDQEARRGWFTLERPERDFKAGEVEQIVVRLAVPADKPTGPSSFRLHVASIKRGDDDFTLGPAVGYEITPIEPVDDGGKFPWWILLVIAGVLLAVVLAVLLWPKGGVPDVVGMTVEEATQTLEEEGLKVGATTSEISEQTAGTVIRQKPEAGAETGETPPAVDLVVAGSLVPVPDLTGKTVDAAKAALAAAKLTSTNVIQRGEGTLGLVTSQNPRAGTQVAPGQDVDLIVPEPVVVPNVVGKVLAAAQTDLQNAKLRPGTVVRAGGFGPGTVVHQEPAAGTTVARGTSVTLRVNGSS